METLIIIDVQRDFCPGGKLPAPLGNEIIPKINNIMDNFELVIASRDVHPEYTRHFEKWPAHCVSGSTGSDFHPDLNTMKIQKVLLKGTDDKDDGYSAFEATNVHFEKYIKDNNIDTLYIAGIATEYCVKNTALDSVKNGIKTYVIKDAIAAVEPGSENEKNALQELKQAGIEMIETKELYEVSHVN